jgi:hypothetical protein
VIRNVALRDRSRVASGIERAPSRGVGEVSALIALLQPCVFVTLKLLRAIRPEANQHANQ